MAKLQKISSEDSPASKPIHPAGSSALARPLRFCAFFLLALTVALGLYLLAIALWEPKVSWLVTGLSGSVAQVVSLCLNLVGTPSSAQGPYISTDRLQLEIVLECTGFYESLILMAAVVAYPCPWKRKLLGLFLFIGLIYVINLVRMAGLAVIGQYSMQLFNLAHVFVVRISSILIIVILWLWWIKSIALHEKRETPLSG